MSEWKLIADISKHNGNCDLAKMKKAGVKGVIIRAGYRSYDKGRIVTDPKFSENMKKAVAAGLPAGVYWWTQSMSISEAKEEADACINLVGNYKLALPVFLDLEYYAGRQGRADHISAANRTKYALAFLERCKERGFYAGVYCNPDFWKSALIGDQLKTFPRWIAHYNANSATMDCDMWQYTDSGKGSTYGVESERIDLNRMYTDFISGKKSKFEPAPKSVDMALLKKGDRGQQVVILQSELNRHMDSTDTPDLNADGIFGPLTESAVREFQKRRGLEADGEAGPDTWAELLTAAN